jgi:hypothetical protein
LAERHARRGRGMHLEMSISEKSYETPHHRVCPKNRRHFENIEPASPSVFVSVPRLCGRYTRATGVKGRFSVRDHRLRNQRSLTETVALTLVTQEHKRYSQHTAQNTAHSHHHRSGYIQHSGRLSSTPPLPASFCTGLCVCFFASLTLPHAICLVGLQRFFSSKWVPVKTAPSTMSSSSDRWLLLSQVCWSCGGSFADIVVRWMRWLCFFFSFFFFTIILLVLAPLLVRSLSCLRVYTWIRASSHIDADETGDTDNDEPTPDDAAVTRGGIDDVEEEDGNLVNVVYYDVDLIDPDPGSIRERIWRFMDKPFSSKPAMILSIFIMGCILFSVVTFVLETCMCWWFGSSLCLVYAHHTHVLVFCALDLYACVHTCTHNHTYTHIFIHGHMYR